jgi:hypothetical protein
VQRAIDRRTCGELLCRQPAQDLVERERVAAELVRVRLEVGDGRLGRFLIALDRRRLAAAGLPLVLERDLNDLGLVLRAARDRERLGELQGDDLGA